MFAFVFPYVFIQSFRTEKLLTRWTSAQHEGKPDGQWKHRSCLFVWAWEACSSIYTATGKPAFGFSLPLSSSRSSIQKALHCLKIMKKCFSVLSCLTSQHLFTETCLQKSVLGPVPWIHTWWQICASSAIRRTKHVLLLQLRYLNHQDML